MSNPNFKPGDRFRFIRDNSDGGSKFGRAGAEYTVELSQHRRPGRLGFRHPDFAWTVGAYVQDIEKVEEPAAAQASPPRSTSIQAVKVSKADILDVLTAYVRDTLGLDAEVVKALRGADSYELVFKPTRGGAA